MGLNIARNRLGWLAALMLAGGSFTVSASSIYSDFGTNNSYDSMAGWSANATKTTYTDVAANFTAAHSGDLGSLVLAIGLSGSNNDATALLDFTLTTADFNGLPSIVPLESWTSAVDSPLLTLNSITHITLNAGTTYWITASVDRSSPSFNSVNTRWYETPLNNVFGFADRYQSNPAWQNFPKEIKPAFSVNSVPVPLPPAVTGGVILCIAAAGLGFAKRLSFHRKLV